MIVIQKRKHFVFGIYIDRIDWNLERIIWIGFYKNNNNTNCLIKNLPKDLIKYILNIVGTFVDDSESQSYIKI